MTSSIKRLMIAAVALLLPAVPAVSPAPPVSSIPPSWPTTLTIKFSGNMDTDTLEITYDPDGSGIGEYDRISGLVRDTGDVLISEVDGAYVIMFASVWSSCVGTLVERNDDPELQGPHGHTGMYTFTVSCDGLSQPGGAATQNPLPYWENH